MLVALLAVALLAQSNGEEPDFRFGHTSTQIIAMGYDSWYKLFHERLGDGESTMSMTRCSYVYADALKDVNRTAQSKLSRARSGEVEALRKALNGFVTASMRSESELAGGGTMYQLFFASGAVEVEEAIARAVDVLRGSGKAPAATQASVDAESRRVYATIRKWSAAERAVGAEQFAAVRSATKGWPRGVRRSMYEFCRKQATPTTLP